MVKGLHVSHRRSLQLKEAQFWYDWRNLGVHYHVGESVTSNCHLFKKFQSHQNPMQISCKKEMTRSTGWEKHGVHNFSSFGCSDLASSHYKTTRFVWGFWKNPEPMPLILFFCLQKTGTGGSLIGKYQKTRTSGYQQNETPAQHCLKPIIRIWENHIAPVIVWSPS